MLRFRMQLVVVAAAAAVSACGADVAADDPATSTEDETDAAAPATATTSSQVADPLDVVVTTTILGEIVQQVVDDRGSVEVLLQPGQDPHGFSPSAQQAQALRAADLVVANGLQLEESLLDTLEAAEADGAAVLRVAEQLDPLPATGDPHSEHAHGDDAHADDAPLDDAQGHEAGDDHAEETASDEGDAPDESTNFDPHVWLDPVRMADGAEAIAERLAEVDTGSAVNWAARGDAVASDILAAHETVEATLADVPARCRELVTNHDALAYFADRYGFEVIGTVVPGTTSQVDPSAEEFAALAETLRSNPVPAIFAETTQPVRLAEALAGDVGRDLDVVPLYTGSLGEPGSGADTYNGMLTTNAELIADALATC